MKVCFISHHYKSPEVFLNTILKMTPGRKGIWKDMEAVLDPQQADFVAVFDGITDNRGVNVGLKVPLDRTLFFGEHPDCSPAYNEWTNTPALAKYPLKRFLNPGEWWLDYDYDYLMALDKPQKTKKLICVFTGHTHRPMYVKRKEWVKGFCQYYKELDLYGRPVSNFTSDPVLKKYHKGHLGVLEPIGVLGQHTTGKEGLIDYKYSLEFDVGPTIHYISERFYDAMLLWTMPFYFGSTNVHEYLPADSFRYIDTDKPDYKFVVDTMDSGYYDTHIDSLAIARDMLLNKYQIWPYVYDKIQELK
jgi:hypothetical protein